MCGIAGVMFLDGRTVDPGVLRRMTHELVHRGPDGAGHWVDASRSVGLGHRRLAIIDLSESASQPMQYLGRYTITYNGEIYNYVELKEELRSRGYCFATQSDTEVVLAAYAAYGEDCLEKFDGMFAFAIWDEVERRLFCARDRFGEKPFYYHHVAGRQFLFASEMKALFAAGVERKRSLRMLFNYLAYDVVQDPFHPTDTFYEGIASLEPSHALTVRLDGRGAEQPRRYWQITLGTQGEPPDFEQASERFKALLTESVRRRLRSDVPVGSSLSGGIDSSSIVCIMSRLIESREGIQETFSARFADEALDEGGYIESAAKEARVAPHYTWPSGQRLAADLQMLMHHQEEPFGGASVFAQWEVMRLAKENGTVVLLDGQGADETLGGYLHFFRPYLLSLFKADRARFEAEVAAYERLHRRRFEAGWRFRFEAAAPKLMRWLGAARRRLMVPEHLAWLDRDFVEAYGTSRPPFKSFDNLNEALRFFSQDYGLRNLLRFADRSSMAFSREVRLPFLSHELVEFVFALPETYKIQAGWTKRILRQAMVDIVPDPVRLRVDKLGFQPPQEEWMECGEMRTLLDEGERVLRRERIIRGGRYGKEAEWKMLMAGLWLEPAA